MSALTLFRQKGPKSNAALTSLDTFTQQLRTHIDGAGGTFKDPSLGSAAVSMESFTETVAGQMSDVLQELNVALESVLGEVGMKLASKHDEKDPYNKFGITQVQMDSAMAAGMMATNVEAFLGANYAAESMRIQPDDKFRTTKVMDVFVSDGVDNGKRLALEAYDEKDNKNAMVYSVAYNMQAAKQDAFAEMFFPTIIVTPDQVGFTMSIRLINVYNEVRRDISGKPSNNFNKRNIVQAVIDPTILRNDTTRIYPVVRPESEAVFVDEALVAPRNITLDDGQVITTAPLKMQTELSLLAVSQTDALLQTGIMDSTDAIDTALGLDALYLQLGSGGSAEVVKFNTRRLPLATFNYAPQGNYRTMLLNFSTTSLLVQGTTTKVDGSASTLLAPLATNNVQVRLGTYVSGQVNCELGDTSLMSSQVRVVSVRNADGEALDLTSGVGATIAAIFAGAQFIGYDLEARRTNSNRRERGQLLDTTFYNQVYAVPLRAPITIPRPLTVGDANDSSDLAALITATHVRTTNAAIDELLNAANVLEAYVSNLDPLGTVPDVLGVTRFLVKPFFERKTIDVAAVINNLKTSERPMDLSAVIVGYLRDVVYRMYTASGYKAAADALAGGVGPVPTVIIGTDPTIARWINVEGDLRTLGGSFNVRIESTLNENMAGKIVVSFGEFGTGKEGVPNPMHFGNMAWKPELTLVLPLHRNGANSKELTVQPSFLHVVNLPVMAMFDVINLSAAATDKISIDFNNVTPAP